jgi:hypothetical protein
MSLQAAGNLSRSSHPSLANLVAEALVGGTGYPPAAV